MPELPDITVYLEALGRRVAGEPVCGFRVVAPNLIRTFSPPIEALVGRRVEGFRRVGKRIVWELDGGLWCVVHLMVAGRLVWKDQPGVPIPRRVGSAAWDFPRGTLILTERGNTKRAGVWILSDVGEVEAMDRGGVDPLTVSFDGFRRAILSENRTLKRMLTDQRIVSGVGNAYSDEILWRAGMSPVARTGSLDEGEVRRLYEATKAVLEEWIDRLRRETGEGWPTKVTAFRPEMAVHGKYGKPCPRCGTTVQRIVYASNETNYCPRCQTGGKVLADRSLSRLLKDDWPCTVEELEGVKKVQ